MMNIDKCSTCTFHCIEFAIMGSGWHIPLSICKYHKKPVVDVDSEKCTKYIKSNNKKVDLCS